MPSTVKRKASARRLKAQFREVQDFWSARAKEKGILTERDLERVLRKGRSETP